MTTEEGLWFAIIIGIIFFVVLLLEYFGNKCPKCKSYKTHQIFENHIPAELSSNNSNPEKMITFKCESCKYRWIVREEYDSTSAD